MIGYLVWFTEHDGIKRMRAVQALNYLDVMTKLQQLHPGALPYRITKDGISSVNSTFDYVWGEPLPENGDLVRLYL